MPFRTRRMLPRGRRSFRSAGNPKWLAWTATASLTAVNTTTSAAILTPAEYEVVTAMQADVSIVVSIGGIVVVNVGGTTSQGGIWGIQQQDAGVADAGSALHQPTATNLTDRRWLSLLPWSVTGDLESFTRSYRIKQRIRMKNHDLIISFTHNVGGTGTFGTTTMFAWGRYLVTRV